VPNLARDIPRGENQLKRSMSRPSGQPPLLRLLLLSPLPLLLVSELSSVVSSKPAASGTCYRSTGLPHTSEECTFCRP
jgi:hypothetical protein